MNTMTATKTLVLAAIGALAITAGSAVAQAKTTIYPGVGFFPPQVVTTGPNGRPVYTAPTPEDYRYQWGTLNNPG